MDVDLVASGILEEDTIPLIDHNTDLSNFEGGRCGICMDIIIDRGVLDCCQHWFCFACIDNWATITNLCPLCQSEFQLITCVPVYDTIGSNKVEDESFSRDDDWSIEGKSNTLSFPSYYIDENAVICLDGDGCKIRSQSTIIEGDPNLDTSIACDSCDIWYHAFCVGFDPEGTSEDTWLCPRCVANQASQKSDVIPEKTNNQYGPEIANSEYVTETALFGKLSVSIADTGETAVIVSRVGGKQWTEEPSENFLSNLEVKNGQKIELSNSDDNCCDTEKPSCDKSTMQPILMGQELQLCLSRNTFSSSLPNFSVHDELKTSQAAETIKEPSSLDGVGNTLGKSLNESFARSQLSESESSLGLHLGLSIGSFLSVDDDRKGGGSKDQLNPEYEHQSHMEELSPLDEKTEPDKEENAGSITGLKRKSDVVISSDGEETKGKNETEAFEKKIRVEGLVHTAPDSQGNASVSDDTLKSPTLKAVSRDGKVKNHPEKEDSIPNIMSIVQSTSRRTSSKGLGCRNPADESPKGENSVGLRVKKIMRRASEDKESSVVVQELRKEIREAVRDKSSKEFGENLFDPKLLAAFRAAISGPKTETVKKLSPSAVKMKKSLLQKGKVRENLTKKIYGDSNGRRRRAWDRDCEVEFWKYRCMRASKPEKIETLKSVLDLLRKNPGGSEGVPISECQASNPILSRLYLADTSVFPRKDDIRPLSALKTTGSSEHSREHVSVEKTPVSSLDIRTVKNMEANKVSSKLGVLSTNLKGTKTSFLNSKGTATSSKVNSNRGSEGSSTSPSSNSKVESQKEVAAKSDDVKVDKRKLALAVLARKRAAESKNGTQERQEDNAVFKGNYPLLAQLPVDMRPSLAPSRHNKVPVSVRQAQLYRLTEHFLRKANLPIIRRTAETELAVADAINIEREVADRSNSKVVYLNLCSQEILHRLDDSKCVRAKESDTSSPSEISVGRQDQVNDACSTDPVVLEALRNAGLLSDSPPSSPHHKTEVPNEVDDSSVKIREEEPDNVFEMDTHLEADIYGDFEYDLEDEDYIGVSAEKAPKLQPEEGVSKMKVVFSTFNMERSKSNNLADSEDHEKLGNFVVPNESSCLLKNNNDAVIKCSTVDDGTDRSCAVLESLHDEEGEELSIAECDELYGPDKEPLINKYSEASQKIYGLVDAEALAENTATEDNEKHGLHHIVNASEPGIQSKEGNKVVDTLGHGSSGGESSADQIQTGENVKKKEKKSNMETDKQSNGDNPVSKKVEAYIKEHIRPLCKSGVITTEQYRWAVGKATEKVMKYHLNAKNANFLIKEGEKVKKLAEQYIEAAQQKEKTDPL
ncbi:uncharacterized protein At4g10930-like isoform X2 [Durio zibethinus]|uniref:Uncharacterized protein At4g10930-like isoform X2 n=1 Tax=Durio zibethinus TaxID=66656 RepID=A0A6P6A920_DURZI|nr:uncharacterized protein At4g10930-like isoform X2 [Durio zibethinus]